jgi:hypothetical protein
MFFGFILSQKGDAHTVMFLRWGKGGRLDPHAGERSAMRDSNRGRGEDDHPAEQS